MAKKHGRSGRLTAKSAPNPIDKHVGTRIRFRRTIMGLNQTALANRMGIAFQQLHKYEAGVNRVSCSRLFDLSRILHVNIAYFFDDMDNDVAEQSPRALQGRSPAEIDLGHDPAAKRETLELVRAYYGIADPQLRQLFARLIRAIAAGE